MKSILIITPFLPYPIRSGGEQAQFNMIDRLRQVYRISIVFPLNKDNHETDTAALSVMWPEVALHPFPLRDQMLHLPFLVRKGWRYLNRRLNPFRGCAAVVQVLSSTDFLLSDRYKLFLETVIGRESPDVIQVEFLSNLNVAELLPAGIPKIFIHHEIGFVMTERTLRNIAVSPRLQRRMAERKATEVERLNRYDAVVTLTDTDCDLLHKAGVHKPIHVSPAAVNTVLQEYDGWNGTILFIGGYHHRPNQEGIDWFLQRVAPLIPWSAYPQTELRIVGMSWPQSYEGDHGGLRVRLLGYVDDLAASASRCIMMVPLLAGSGMRMKILDAAALSLPIVTTSVGAEGLCFRAGESCLIGDGAEGFAMQLRRMLDDGRLRETVGRKAHEVYLQHYSVERLVAVRRRIYESVMQQGNAPGGYPSIC